MSALALYAILARDPTDFLDMLPEESDDELKTLYQMLTLPEPPPNTDVELNKLGAGMVERVLLRRGMDPEAIRAECRPTRWDRIFHDKEPL